MLSINFSRLNAHSPEKTWTSTHLTDLLDEASREGSNFRVNICAMQSFQSALRNFSPLLAERCRELCEDETETTTDQSILNILRHTLSPPSSVSISPEASPILPVERAHEEVDQLTLLQNVSNAIFNFHSANAVLTAVSALDSEATERFLRHASEHAGRSITADNLMNIESQEALFWALSEEASRYISLTHHFSQDEWNLLDYFVWEADGSRSSEVEFGKYHRMDRNLDSFLAQAQKVLSRRL